MKHANLPLAIAALVFALALPAAAVPPKAVPPSDGITSVDPRHYLRTRNQKPNAWRELLARDVADSVAILKRGPDAFLAPEDAYPATLKQDARAALRDAERVTLLTGALNAVVQKRHPDAVALVQPLLEHADPRVRAEAAERLGMTRGDVVTELAAVARDDADADVRAAALLGLGHHRSTVAFDALEVFVRDHSRPAEQAIAVRALKLLGSSWAWQARGDEAQGARLRERTAALLRETHGRP